MQPHHFLFDHRLKRLHRQRAMKLLNSKNNLLLREVAARLIERLTQDITPVFSEVLLLDSTEPSLVDYLRGRKGTKILRKESLEEESLSFPPESFDLIVSFMALQWVNDLPGTLIQMRHLLKKNGLFLAAFPGGRTLHELRHAALEAEAKLRGGASPRVSPMVDVRDAGMLLQRAGFALPVADSETITMLYHDAYALMRDLRALGETNALLKRQKTFTPRGIISAINDTYQNFYRNSEGLIPATFEIITLTGWKE